MSVRVLELMAQLADEADEFVLALDGRVKDLEARLDKIERQPAPVSNQMPLLPDTTRSETVRRLVNRALAVKRSEISQLEGHTSCAMADFTVAEWNALGLDL